MAYSGLKATSTDKPMTMKQMVSTLLCSSISRKLTMVPMMAHNQTKPNNPHPQAPCVIKGRGDVRTQHAEQVEADTKRCPKFSVAFYEKQCAHDDTHQNACGM